MSFPARRSRLVDATAALLGSAPFGRSITLTIVGTSYLAFVLKATMGWPGLIGIVSTLVPLSALSLYVRRRELEWRGILPISLLVFVGWSGLSIFWSEYQWASLGSILYQVAFTFLGVYVALTRDLIQIIRAFGDVFRVLLVASLALELLSGLLLDVPIDFLHIAGNLYEAGPIQGVMGGRDMLGLVALLALVTFFVEWRTHSVQRGLATGSMILGALTVLLTRSSIAFGVLAVAALAAAALFALRQMKPTARRIGQFVIAAGVVVLGIVTFVARSRLIEFMNARTVFDSRLTLWHTIIGATPANPLEGFGWVGYWRPDLPPFISINEFTSLHQSALNAYLDVWLQLGVVGVFAFVAFVGLALGRSWLLASNKRSVVYLWPALVLVVLLSISITESSALVEFGWLTVVICALKASQDLSWRARLPESDRERG